MSYQQTLCKWLTPGQIDRLVSRVALARKIQAAHKTEPTFLEEKKRLTNAMNLACELASILCDAPPELDIAFLSMGGIDQKDALAKQLRYLSDAVDERLATMPTQARATSHGLLVAMIAEVARDAGIKPSVSSGSKFFKICKIVFADSGIYVDPKGSIDAYLKEINRG